MANLSQEKREKMLKFLDKLNDQYTDDDSIRAITEIKNYVIDKKYGLVWEEHEEYIDSQMRENIPVFTECIDKKITDNPDEKYNFILEGDNLQSLSLLEKAIPNQVDVIYIDPPYNRGKDDDFKYDDNYVDKEDGFKHSKWLSFMNERLKRARTLLSDKGVVFISIDENEFAQLKLLCDEIFGPDNFVDCLVWNKRVPKNDKGIGNIHEYILLYTKSTDFKYKFTMIKEGLEKIDELMYTCKKEHISIQETENRLKKLYKKEKYDRGITLYNCVDENYKVWGKINMSWPNGNSFGPKYDIMHPVTLKPVKIPDRGWRWKQSTFNEAVDYDHIVRRYDGSYVCGNIWFSKDENMQPSSIKYLDDVNRMLLRSIISLKSDGSIELEKIFGEKSTFSYPKSVELIKLLIDSITYDNKNALILDFFAGSGTTAQAVMELNEEDGGNRRFILCTNNEVAENEQIEYFTKNGYIKPRPKKESRGKTKAEKEKENAWRKTWDDFKKSQIYKNMVTNEDYQNRGICRSITYPRVKTIASGIRIDGTKYSDGCPINLKYFKCDWILRKPENYFLSNALCRHIKEMIEIRTGFEIDNIRNILILNKDDFYTYLTANADHMDIRIWVNQDILFNAEEMELLNTYDFKYIPREFFGQELQEAAE